MGGQFLVRIEDTDVARSTPEFTEQLICQLAWLGLVSDEPIVCQSQRLEIYQNRAQAMIQSGHAYTSEDAVFFKVPKIQTPLIVRDALHGDIEFDPALIDDFVILRQNKTPVYNFSCVIDDTEMGITHVIRGDDHLSNTPRQLLIYQALYETLNLTIPLFVHVPMILGPDGQRLSKRHGATSIDEYQHQGILASAMINYLVRLGWAHGNQEIFSLNTLIDLFSLDQLSKKAAIFDEVKLAWVNREHIKMLSDEKIVEVIDNRNPQFCNHPAFTKALHLLRPKSTDIPSIEAGLLYLLGTTSLPIDTELREIIKQPNIQIRLNELMAMLTNLPTFTANAIELAIRELALTNKLNAADYIHPLRFAATGKKVTPGIFEVIELIGKLETLKRINIALDQ